MTSPSPDVAIIGAGPVGLDAALAASGAGWPFTIYEAAPAAAGHIRRWGHVQLFTPWTMNASPRMRRRLEREGREVPRGEACPTGDELVAEVLEPVAELPEIAPNLETDARVATVGREGLLKHEEIGSEERAGRRFRLLIEDADGGERVERADIVLDCTGTYGNANALGTGGIPAPGERALNGEVVREIPDVRAEADEWAGATVLLAGAGHSAQTAARDLADLADEHPDTRVIWAIREEEPGWYGVPDDSLPERARLVARAEELASGASPAVDTRRGVEIEALEERGGRVRIRLRRDAGDIERVEVDRVLSLTGSVGDHGLYRQLQVHECYATSAPMDLSAALLGEGAGDCLDQTGHGAEVLTNPEPNFFILGAKSYGRNNTFLMRVGWEQVDEVFGLLGESIG